MARRSPSGVLASSLPNQGVETPKDTSALPPSSTRQKPAATTRTVFCRRNARMKVIPLMAIPVSTAAKKAAAILAAASTVNGCPNPSRTLCSTVRPKT